MVIKDVNPRKLLIPSLFSLAALTACSDQGAGPAQMPSPTVTVVSAKMQEITPSIGFTGRVEAVDAVELRARVEGFLVDRLVEEGSQVEKGDLIFVIEKDNYQAEVKKVEGAIERLKGTKKLAEIERDRRAKLVKSKSIAQEQLDIAIANVTEANGDLITQMAALESAKLDLGYTDITAPISGKVGLSPFSSGDFVGPTSGPLAVLVSQDPMYVTFPVSQKQLLNFNEEAEKEGTPEKQIDVHIRLANGKRYQHTGQINFVDVEANPGTDTLTVRAEFPNPEGVLVHQQLVTVSLEERDPELRLTIPQNTIQIDQVGSYVLLVDEQNQVKVQRIQTGPTISGQVVVTEGLSESQRIISVGIQKVRPGIEVNVVSAEQGE